MIGNNVGFLEEIIDDIVGFLEEIIDDIVEKWNTFGDTTKSCLAIVIYTWIICGIGSVITIVGHWYFVPYLITVLFGYYIVFNADKW